VFPNHQEWNPALSIEIHFPTATYYKRRARNCWGYFLTYCPAEFVDLLIFPISELRKQRLIWLTAMFQGVDNMLSRVNGIMEDGLSPLALLTAIIVPLLLLILKMAYFIPLDSREPPLLRPYVPFVGHIIGLARESNGYYWRLFSKARLPICTLPMLNGKVYVVNSPALIAASMRNRELSFDPFALEFAEGLLGIERKHVDELFGKPGWVQTMTDTIHSAFSGENVRQMKAACYQELASSLNSLEPGQTLGIANSYDWLALLVPRAFTKVLFGAKNPFTDRTIQAIWCVLTIPISLAGPRLTMLIGTSMLEWLRWQ